MQGSFQFHALSLIEIKFLSFKLDPNPNCHRHIPKQVLALKKQVLPGLDDHVLVPVVLEYSKEKRSFKIRDTCINIIIIGTKSLF